MSELLERYLSFRGRLARLPFFLRELSLNITAAVITFASIPLFASGSRLLWWRVSSSCWRLSRCLPPASFP
jgi:uncharacterized membrane protein YhaH (DUF805 family)